MFADERHSDWQGTICPSNFGTFLLLFCCLLFYVNSIGKPGQATIILFRLEDDDDTYYIIIIINYHCD